MTQRRAILLFLDGVGLGPADEASNPFVHVDMPAARDLLGIPHLTDEFAGFASDRAVLLGLDACLGVPGLPQSGTGQTALLTGLNAPALLGEHDGPYPNDRLRDMLRQGNLFQRLVARGQPVAYANAYPRRFLERVSRGKGRLSANTQAALMADLPLRTGLHLQAGQALSAFLTNERWPEPDLSLPVISPKEAGTRLVELANHHTLTFFEFWYSDIVGHRREPAEALRLLRRLDEFLAGILETIRPDTLLVVVSDHGNLEDWSTRRHTRNPALTLLAGPGFDHLARRMTALTDVSPALLDYLLDA